MRYDARVNPDPAARAAFTEWLVREAASGLQRARGDADALRGIVFLYLSRAYEAGLDPEAALQLFGVGPGTAVDEAGLSLEDQEAVIEAYDEQDPLIRRVHGVPDRTG